ncbi:Smc5-Smc6 complex subunit NSE4 KNAG_0A05610 [Huiozyma naganishii CBS 8797]|uniref:Non-structural maintenance of chromosomes element 4 n=1 Tax=Huiozyma naganishii (strain ATCC MYA-139 / BCRC 22969 / CBS 8797 / KCTC 17520 / NBRC 10181 / NCYC 3082 / Yp74L-3) TaxID=1071383 RepID=J7R099_HUIN7|nr:hypothetical protein KNAG_0A05610 [Kazachstania naganishii CBS 8797]CCK68225.1 hypothetical protein KNAG_0A05610 [Kazachstania naganishii CBS 8797]
MAVALEPSKKRARENTGANDGIAAEVSKKIRSTGDKPSEEEGKKSGLDETEPNGTDGESAEFKVLQAYRSFENDISKDRVKVIQNRDIGVTLNKLDSIDSLFQKMSGTKNNGLFAHDSRAMLSISELAHLSVQNLKLGEGRYSITLSDTLSSLKRYMLQDYFKSNGIQEETVGRGLNAADDDDGGVDENVELDSESRSNTTKIRERTLNKEFLEQFSKYNTFNQFNWFRMGALFDNLNLGVPTTDHLLGPFSVEKKRRENGTRPRISDPVGKATKADEVSKSDINDGQDVTTPEHVKRCFKTLLNKNGMEKISLFKFCLDPNSFAKSVENLFYTSFLLKDGKIVLEQDEQDGFPTIRVKDDISAMRPEEREIEKQKRKDAHQNHIIFQMDMPTWRKLLEKLNITSSYID